MPLNNTLEVIGKDQFDKIHNASLKILKETGIQFHSQDALDMFKEKGAKVDGQTVFITEKMVADAADILAELLAEKD